MYLDPESEEPVSRVRVRPCVLVVERGCVLGARLYRCGVEPRVIVSGARKLATDEGQQEKSTEGA
jgi:hypothetical protein